MKRIAGAAAAALLLVACVHEDVVARRIGDASLGGEPGACATQTTLPVLTSRRCEERARFALCTCEAMIARGPVRIEPASEGGSGAAAASIGANGTIHVEAELTAAGAVVSAGAGGTSGSGDATLSARTLASRGPLEGSLLVDIASDAWVGGRIDVGGLTVGGTLTTPEGVEVVSAMEPRIGERVTGEVTVANPCACDAEDHVDVLAQVAAHRTQNDNARAELDPYALDGFSAPLNLSLDCGSYHFSRIAGRGALELVIAGPAAIYVDGDLSIEGSLQATLAPGADLDVFVRGAFVVSGDVVLGDPNASERVRIWVGSTGTVDLGARLVIAGDVDAPRAEVVTRGDVEVHGRLRARRLATEAPLSLRVPAADPLCAGGEP